MSDVILDLGSRVVTSSGEVVLTYDSLVKMARDGKDVHLHRGMQDDFLDKYNRVSREKIAVWTPSPGGEIPLELYEWNTPPPFSDIDVATYVIDRLVELGLDIEEYAVRLEAEITECEERNMMPVMRHVIFMVDDFKRRNVVWGVGRGSSCASLMMFLIGLNKVDPVKYDIPMSEFFK